MQIRRIFQVTVITTLLAFPSPLFAAVTEDNIKNSVGVITFYFEPINGKIYDKVGNYLGEAKAQLQSQCNGFLIQKDGKTFFITVLHLSRRYAEAPYSLGDGSGSSFVPDITQTSRRCKIEIVNTGLVLENFKNDDFVEGDNMPNIGSQKETKDALRIDVTDKMPIGYTAFDSGDLVPLDVQLRRDAPASMFGHPSGKVQNSFMSAKVDISFDPQTFRKIIPINNESPLGFIFKNETQSGDCGRPIIVRAPSGAMSILGFLKTAWQGQAQSLALDSSVVIRLLEWEPIS